MMEPLGHISEYGLEKLKTRRHYCVSVSHQPEKEYTIGIVRLSDAEARIAELEAENAQAVSYCLHLANTMNKRFYHDVSPEFQPFPDIVGLLTQVDNMVAGIGARAEAAEALLKEAREALKASSQLIDRMMHVHVAPDECTSYVEPSRRWFMENGGSLAAIADQQAMNRRALKEKP